MSASVGLLRCSPLAGCPSGHELITTNFASACVPCPPGKMCWLQLGSMSDLYMLAPSRARLALAAVGGGTKQLDLEMVSKQIQPCKL
eukprot:m.123959 g.123959  ORF g.123959 m.123959 type:complete len:87 (+) comp15687_c0_seq24:809-1069(+)